MLMDSPIFSNSPINFNMDNDPIESEAIDDVLLESDKNQSPQINLHEDIANSEIGKYIHGHDELSIYKN